MNPASALQPFMFSSLPPEIQTLVIQRFPLETKALGSVACVSKALNVAVRPHARLLLLDLRVEVFFALQKYNHGSSNDLDRALDQLLEVELPAFLIAPRVVSVSKRISGLSEVTAQACMHAIGELAQVRF